MFYKTWSKRSSFIKLNDNNYGEIPDDWMDKYGDIVHDLLSARQKNKGKKLPGLLSLILQDYVKKLSAKTSRIKCITSFT